MTKVTNDKNNMKSGNPLPGILAAIGIFLMMGSMGNMDYIDAAEQENQNLGYEKHQIDYAKEQKKSTKTLLLGGILTGAGAIGLIRKERMEQGR